MTDEMMNLRSLVEKTPDADLVREMIAFAAERLMELEVGALTGAAHGEKSPTRLVQRNGYREHDAVRRTPGWKRLTPKCSGRRPRRGHDRPRLDFPWLHAELMASSNVHPQDGHRCSTGRSPELPKQLIPRRRFLEVHVTRSRPIPSPGTVGVSR